MTNLKKTLAVVLAFAMILSMGAISTFAYSDVTAGTVVSEAVGILSNLNILTGFEDGTFKPEETVTRAQMAAIICRTLGYEDQAKSSMGSTVFNDVAADHWASGYVNVAQAQQIINGYGDGNFGPEDKVTYEQAVKMIVSALGYDLAAQGKGGYPTGYLAIASAEGITKNANGRVGDAAVRGTIAVLVYNSLEVRLMDQNSWSTDGTDTYGKQDANILTKYLDVAKYEGYVTITPIVKAATVSAYDPTASKEVTINNAAYWKFEAQGTGTTSLYYKEDVDGDDDIDDADVVVADCSLIADIDSFLGKKVVAYIGEDDVLGDRTLFAITEAKNQNSSIVITGDQLVDSASTDYGVIGQISYKNEGSNRVLDATLQSVADGNDAGTDLDTDVDVYINYVKQTASTVLKTSDFANAGKLELISNDYDSDIEVILVTTYTDESVIEEAVFEEGVYSFECYTGGINEIDPEDEDTLAIVYVDGVIADASALKAGYTVSTVEIAGDDFVVHYASSKTVTGAVDSYSTGDKVVTIAGEEYEISPMSLVTIDAIKDQEGTFFLNVDGKIAHNETETIGNSNYGVAILVGQDSSLNKPYVISVAHADGTVVDYELKDNASFVGAAGVDTAAEVAEYVADIMNDGTDDDDVAASTLLATQQYASAQYVSQLVFKFTTKDGKITKIANLDNAGYSYTTNRTYDADAMSYGSAQFDESTIVINIKKNAGDATQIKEEDIEVGKVSTFFADGDSYSFNTFDVKQDIAPLVIGYNLTPSVPEDSAAIVVTNLRTVTYDDDEAVQVTGVQAGEEVTFILYNDTKVLPTLGKGDIILAAAVNADGVANDCEILYDKSANALTAAAAKGDNDDGIYNAYGTLNAADTTNAKFFINVDVVNAGDNGTLGEAASNDDEILYVAAEGIPVKSSANYTLVDYSEDTKNPEVSKKNPGTSLFSKSDKYKSFVFVRVYDEKLAEVVVMRYAATKLEKPSAVTATNGSTASATVASGTTAEYRLNEGAWTTTAPTVATGDTLEVRAIKSDDVANNKYYNASDIYKVEVE